ncbi:MAG TPA: thioredoxin domain-containing protein [Gemmatimonadaceae bacterium]|nr:thioredoxin domain-containing protein [Gemmatimonadaceae bacterium]
METHIVNALAGETSPYLLQHANNPVDWQPWGAAALTRARAEDKPILLSIGYAACHWCHVMAHESFEDPATAQVMNELFVNIKVDREERPDIDAIYMNAVQAMTGQGGWPMTVFLTPDGVPFHGGTYYPPQDRYGMPSFLRVLRSAAEAYRTRRGDVLDTAERVRGLYAAAQQAAVSAGELTPAQLDAAARGISARYDARNGGFEGAPKFPQTMALDFLLRHWRRSGAAQELTIVRTSFLKMARGGIYDQVGGGFHRYAVDDHWLVPHFEKMLYDNALLSRLGVHLWQVTRDPEIERVTLETFDWALREMAAPGGGFYSSLDADSEGHEGKFYVWSAEELDALLFENSPVLRDLWGVSAVGNFEGQNILHVPHAPADVASRNGIALDELEALASSARITLWSAREARVHPARDDKILAGWNGLMVRALADGARAFENARWRAEAVRHGEFLFRELVRDGRVMRVHKDGASKGPGFLEDHAALALAAISLYELTLDERWLARARDVSEATVRWFWDDAAAGFFDTAHDAEPLIARPRELTDNAVPAGNSLAAEMLLRLGDLMGSAEDVRRGAWVLESLGEPLARYPIAFGYALGAAELAVHGATEVAILGIPGEAAFESLLHETSSRYLPSLVLVAGVGSGTSAEGASNALPLLRERGLSDGRATAYVCRGNVCDAPTTDARALGELLERAAARRS